MKKILMTSIILTFSFNSNANTNTTTNAEDQIVTYKNNTNESITHQKCAMTAYTVLRMAKERDEGTPLSEAYSIAKEDAELGFYLIYGDDFTVKEGVDKDQVRQTIIKETKEYYQELAEMIFTNIYYKNVSKEHIRDDVLAYCITEQLKILRNVWNTY